MKITGRYEHCCPVDGRTYWIKAEEQCGICAQPRYPRSADPDAVTADELADFLRCAGVDANRALGVGVALSGAFEIRRWSIRT